MTTMMRVLQITNNYPTKALPIFGVFVKEQIESLADLGILNDIFFINGREKGWLEYLKAIWRLRRKLSSSEYDVVHCHHALSALVLILSGRAWDRSIVVSYQNDPSHELGLMCFRFIKLFASGVIMKNRSPLLGECRGHYLPNGVNTKLFVPMDRRACRKRIGLDSDKIYILFVSSNKLRQQKRYDIFVQTLECLRTTYHLNVEELVISNVSRSEVPVYFAAVDLHLMCSDFEGSPNSVKECLACNIPVVSTNVGNVEELLSNVDGCYVSKSNVPEELAELVYKSLQKRCEKGRDKLIRAGLSSDAVASRLQAIYTSLK